MADPTEPLPVPATTNGWHPIQDFDHSADYAKEPFLVWLPDGRWNEGYVEEAGKFSGEWRHIATEDGSPVPSVNGMEPVAFKLVEGPDLERLSLIVETHHKAA